ncbi:AAA domain-containing protein [Cladophialophora immunda]|nr:AAA domain-containing protein [Cladophialophora immunda]
MAPALDVQADVSIQGEDSINPWEKLARKYWWDKDTTTANVKPEVIKAAIWDPLEQDSFPFHSLAVLENYQILERFLWPTFSPDSSNHHVLLIVVFFNVKQRARIHDWALFNNRPAEFSTLLRRVLSLILDSSLSIFSRLSLLHFVLGAFQSLENDQVRKECAPLVSIATWHNLHDERTRERLLEANPARKKAWRAAARRYDAADLETQSRLRFDRAWLYTMLIDFIARLNAPKLTHSQEMVYCERFVEFLIDLTSQLPTRRYTNPLLKDVNIIPIIRKSKLYEREDAVLLHDLTNLLEHFQSFAIDELGGTEESHGGLRRAHYQALERLQRVALQSFEDKLKVLALSNFGSIDKRSELESHFSSLTDSELQELCTQLGFRTSYPPAAGIAASRAIMMETLLSSFSKPQDFREVVTQLAVLPTAASLYDPALLRNEHYDGSRPLGFPKLNLQYLTLSDFMWRSFQLYQAEAFYGIRKDMESIVKRMKPKSPQSLKLVLRSHLTDGIRREWDNLRPHDVVFLLAVNATNASRLLTNGHSGDGDDEQRMFTGLRAAEVVQVLTDDGRTLRDTQTNGHPSRPRRRRLLLDLDASTYDSDKQKQGRAISEIASLNVIARRQGRENNFKPVLETIQALVSSETVLPSWLQEVYLGYGDPQSASFPSLPDHIDSIDYLDTFLDWQHLLDSFPGKTVETGTGQPTPLEPPYILQRATNTSTEAPANPKKRRRDQMEQDSSIVKVSTYKPRNTGPYPMDAPRKNKIRFTAKQVDAIVCGTQPGLTVVVGPPGTGKTDVATQTINLLYHNFPSERILLVAHSNQALNQLFQKIIALDIDPRHLLRLGHGEEELDTEASYNKYGRVESFLENRQFYLSEVNRLATSIGAEGAHGASCETADYFNQVFIRPGWQRFWDITSPFGPMISCSHAGFLFFIFAVCVLLFGLSKHSILRRRIVTRISLRFSCCSLSPPIFRYLIHAHKKYKVSPA